MIMKGGKELYACRDALQHHAIICVKGVGTLLDRIVVVSERLLERGLFAATHESMIAQRQPVPDHVLAWPRVKDDWGSVFFTIYYRGRA